MNRTLRALIEDYEREPNHWEIVQTQSAPSTSRRNRGGASVQELLRHRLTGEEMVRHTLRKSDGSLFSPAHYRPQWKLEMHHACADKYPMGNPECHC